MGIGRRAQKIRHLRAALDAAGYNLLDLITLVSQPRRGLSTLRMETHSFEVSNGNGLRG